ncbi:DUF4231 domain-containing protein [Nesterenkonia sp. CF4.4]|uniref:DUF4231 domain-containing protein n=1 Tax=Nesterenkonia sp. CF4.4 TaxID=3373079 RepID=UPI003EE534BE
MSQLDDADLPPFFIAADSASLKAQKATLNCNRVRLLGVFVGALGGIFSFVVGQVDTWAVIALLGFAAAFVAELYIAMERPEKGWYQARAGAESTKTLSWRYSVGADPFFLDLPDGEVDNLFRTRLSQVATEVSQVVPLPRGDGSSPTKAMRILRQSSIQVRRSTYLSGRTQAQRDWYTRKADVNRRASRQWRAALLTAETVAIILAAGRLFGGWTIDLAGVIAAGVGAAAAWLALKQHTTLSSAYALTAAELEKQISTLKAVSDADWPKSVADAEEAISREHTMWLASRGEVNESIG